MTFDKSGQDTSLNVRVGVQVPQRGVTWFHLCILQTVFMNSAVLSLTVGWCQQPGHLQCWAGAVLSNTRSGTEIESSHCHQQPLLISDFIQNTIFGGGEARRGSEVEECQKCCSPLIDVTLLATRL